MNKTMQEKGDKESLLPHYYRLITAKLIKRRMLVILILELIVLLLVCVFLFAVYLEYEKTKVERSRQVSQLVLWEAAIKKHPSYPQAYYNAALHAARLGDSQKALSYIEKALSLNENYEPAKQLKKLLMK